MRLNRLSLLTELRHIGFREPVWIGGMWVTGIDMNFEYYAQSFVQGRWVAGLPEDSEGRWLTFDGWEGTLATSPETPGQATRGVPEDWWDHATAIYQDQIVKRPKHDPVR